MKTLLAAIAVISLHTINISASPLERRDSHWCGDPGYQSGTDSFITTSDGGYLACSALCFAYPECKNFAWSTTECNLYNVDLETNLNIQYDSPYFFYDRRCETDGKQCGTTGYQYIFDSYWYSNTVSFLTCASTCKKDKNCKSYVYGNGECLLYEVPVGGNINPSNQKSPYYFYDVACPLPSSSSTTTGVTTPKTTTKSSAASTTSNSKTLSTTSKTSSSTTKSSSNTISQSTTSSLKTTTKSLTTTINSSSSKTSTTSARSTPVASSTTITTSSTSTTYTTTTPLRTTTKSSSTTSSSSNSKPSTTTTSSSTSKTTTSSTKKSSSTTSPSQTPTSTPICALQASYAKDPITSITYGLRDASCTKTCLDMPSCKSFSVNTYGFECAFFADSVSLSATRNTTTTTYFYDIACSTTNKVCGEPGWNSQFAPFMDGQGYTLDSCASECLDNESDCGSFAFGNGECHFYGESVTGNINKGAESPYKFYDARCFGNGTTSR